MLSKFNIANCMISMARHCCIDKKQSGAFINLDIDGSPLSGCVHEMFVAVIAGFGQEDSQMIVEGMAEQGNEPTYCMGDDIPLPVLSDRPHILYNYFKQRFAQVTNPPIDPLREGLVMSLAMRLGHRGNLLQPGPDAYSQVGSFIAPGHHCILSFFIVLDAGFVWAAWSATCRRPQHVSPAQVAPTHKDCYTWPLPHPMPKILPKPC